MASAAIVPEKVTNAMSDEVEYSIVSEKWWFCLSEMWKMQVSARK